MIGIVLTGDSSTEAPDRPSIPSEDYFSSTWRGVGGPIDRLPKYREVMEF